MKTDSAAQDHADSLYEELSTWHVNTGEETIHAKRMPGRFRALKWLTACVWLVFFLGPYLRWHGKQAILLDIPNRQFHFFDLTILPQDVWMLAMVLLFFAILLAAVTSVAGRVFCGYFCFQTVWTDIFTWIEERLEGAPAKRRKLEQAPWSARKIRIKGIKHFLWLLIAMLTGISFAAWFTDAFQLWHDYFTLQAGSVAWAVLGLFTAGTYVLAGHMREQACFWLCPYARIQGVMYDRDTVLPAYDFERGEPRGKLKKGKIDEGKGDCIDCGQCVAVCPTGIDIRSGQQEGCITCALCIDACDSVMDKIGRPRGLIRYASLHELEGGNTVALYKRPRVLIYLTIIVLAISGLVYGLTHLGSLELKVLHERQPLYVLLSNGSIQNKYTVKILNKTDQDMPVHISASGIKGMTMVGVPDVVTVRKSGLSSFSVYVRVPHVDLPGARAGVKFQVQGTENPKAQSDYESMFMGPRK